MSERISVDFGEKRSEGGIPSVCGVPLMVAVPVRQTKVFSNLYVTVSGIGSPHEATAQFVQHPMPGSIDTLQMLLGSASLHEYKLQGSKRKNTSVDNQIAAILFRFAMHSPC